MRRAGYKQRFKGEQLLQHSLDTPAGGRPELGNNHTSSEEIDYSQCVDLATKVAAGASNTITIISTHPLAAGGEANKPPRASLLAEHIQSCCQSIKKENFNWQQKQIHSC